MGMEMSYRDNPNGVFPPHVAAALHKAVEAQADEFVQLITVKIEVFGVCVDDDGPTSLEFNVCPTKAGYHEAPYGHTADLCTETMGMIADFMGRIAAHCEVAAMFLNEPPADLHQVEKGDKNLTNLPNATAPPDPRNN